LVDEPGRLSTLGRVHDRAPQGLGVEQELCRARGSAHNRSRTNRHATSRALYQALLGPTSRHAVEAGSQIIGNGRAPCRTHAMPFAHSATKSFSKSRDRRDRSLYPILTVW
jgi:hypothetical protein